MSEIPDIAELLPHKQPMILIDRLISADVSTLHCQVNISAQNLFFDAQSNSIPAWVGIEFMAQSIAAWSGYRAWKDGLPAPVGFLLGSRRYNSDCPAFNEGMLLDVYGEQLMESDGMSAFACRIESNGELLASSQLNVFVPGEEKLQDMLKEANDD